MRLFEIIKTAANNLRRNKTRSFLTIIAIFVGSLTITFTTGIGSGIKSYLNNQIEGLGASNILMTTQGSTDSSSDSSLPKEYDATKIKSQSAGISAPGAMSGSQSSFMLTQSDINIIAKDSDVAKVNPMLGLTPDYVRTSGKKYQVSAQPVMSDSLNFSLAAGKSIDAKSDSYGVLLPTFYLSVLGFSDAESAVGKNITIAVSDQNGNRKEFTSSIVGVINKSLVTSNSIILNKVLSKDAVDYQNIGKPDSQKDLYSIAVTEFKKDLTNDQVASLKDRLNKLGYSASTIKDQQQLLFSVIDAIVMVLNLFGVIALTAASFGIINTLYMAVQERTKEIGLLKAVGMSRSKIFALFSVEAAFLGLIGSSLGVAVASISGYFINNLASSSLLKDFEGLRLLSFEPVAVLTIIGIVTAIAFLAGTLPARKASKLDPIEALRYE